MSSHRQSIRRIRISEDLSPPQQNPAANAAPVSTKMLNISAAAGVDTRLDMFEHVFDNMSIKSTTGLLLAGSTGIGKTTFVKQLGKLLGMNVELIEAPHITEEHLINIPFITFKPNGTASSSSIHLDPANVNVNLANSHLASLLRSSQPIPDSTYIANSKKFDNNTRTIYQRLGGDESTIPTEIVGIRKRFKTILFLDEYWRQTSANVRNILRGILNGRIGNDRIPSGVYVIYASNISDVGSSIEDIPLNADFKMIDFKPPTKDEFFHYLISAAESKGIKLNPQLINAFHAALNDSHISYDDAEKTIRTSPRRWEQLILYINAALPIDSKSKAASLLANVRANFSSEEEISDLHRLVDTVVRDVITQTGGEAFKDTRANTPTNWRTTLEHQIAMKMKMGDTRSYIPVVMGKPGIGKTAQMSEIADKLNLMLVSIDSSTLTVDDITGIPIPKYKSAADKDATVSESIDDINEADDGSGDLDVGFAQPSLYKRIMSDAKEAEDDFLADPNVRDEKKAAFKSQKYKYLLFFDELNRVGNQNVFNSLRRVILDKSFNDTTHLPDNMIIVAAMNPDDKGTTELTGHLKDAVDLIDTAPSWSALQEWLNGPVDVNMGLTDKPAIARDTARKVIDRFAATFTTKLTDKDISLDSMKFHIKIGDATADMMYISPREYSSLYAELVAGISRAMTKSAKADDDQAMSIWYNAIKSKMESTLNAIMAKHQIDSPQFMQSVNNWLKAEMPSFMIKSRDSASLEAMLDDVLADENAHLKDNPNFVHYATTFERNKFSEDVANYFEKLMENEVNKWDIWAKSHVRSKNINDEKVSLFKDIMSKLETVHDEIYSAAHAFDLSFDLIDSLDHSIINTFNSLAAAIKLPEDLADDLINKGLEVISRVKWTS